MFLELVKSLQCIILKKKSDVGDKILDNIDIQKGKVYLYSNTSYDLS
jgi:hypothetical protein